MSNEAARRQDAKNRELDKKKYQFQRVCALKAPLQKELNDFQRQINEWLTANSSSGIQSIDGIKTQANALLSSRRGVSTQSLQKQIANEQKVFRQKEASLELPEGGIEAVNARFQEQEEKMESIDREIAVHLKNYNDLASTHRSLQKRYVELRNFLCGSVESSFEIYLMHKKYVGKMTFDHEKCILTTNVDVNSRGSTKEVSAVGSHKNLSGGENSYSNVCLLLALSSVSPCPWQVLDEFDVFMYLKTPLHSAYAFPYRRLQGPKPSRIGSSANLRQYEARIRRCHMQEPVGVHYSPRHSRRHRSKSRGSRFRCYACCAVRFSLRSGNHLVASKHLRVSFTSCDAGMSI